MDHTPPLPLGYSPVGPGRIAAVVTSLQMLAPPPPRGSLSLPEGVRLTRLERPSTDRYRSLYRAVGQDWLWFSRIVMAEAPLSAILHDPLVQIYALQEGARDLGLLELDFRAAGECELAFFGLVPDAVGGGLGRVLMNEAIRLAWAQPITRFWVHTCSYDHPAALAFYRRSGFVPYALHVEVAEDPRLTGALPPDSAPHVPKIDPVAGEG